MSKPLVIYVITYLAVGGAQKVVLSLAENLDREKFDVWLATGPGGDWQERGRNIEGVPFFEIPHMLRTVAPFSDTLAVYEVCSIIRKAKQLDPERPIIVHSHAPVAGVVCALACRICRVQHVHTIHGWPFFDGQSPVRYRAYKLFAGLTFIAPGTKIISVSKHNLEIGLQAGWFDAADARVIPPCTELDRFCPRKGGRSFLNDYGITDEDSVIGMVAAFKPPKDHLTLVKAVSLLRERGRRFKLVFAGEGEMETLVKDALRAVNLLDDAVFLGPYDRADRLIPEFDVLVLPSLQEGLPIVLIEARASGVPAIACPVSGVKEVLIDGVNGVYTPISDHETLSNAISRVLDDHVFRNSLITNGLENLDIYSIPYMVSAHERCYIEAISE